MFCAAQRYAAYDVSLHQQFVCVFVHTDLLCEGMHLKVSVPTVFIERVKSWYLFAWTVSFVESKCTPVCFLVRFKSVNVVERVRDACHSLNAPPLSP